LQCLRAANLVGARRARILARRWAGSAEPGGCEARVRELIARGVLTRYQAGQVLAGRARRLRLGPYRVLDRLGIGGMGQVYKAEHILMRRVVALKIVARLPRADSEHDTPVPGEPSRRELLARFRREVRCASRMSHPNVVTAYDAGSARGFLFLVMEYVEGTDLGRFVAEYGPLPVPLACEAARQAALALQYAHERNLVHRDVKPDNLLLMRSGSEPATGACSLPSLPDGTSGDGAAFVKLLDLGLALPSNRLPRRAERAGTPDFMAPELANGHGPVDGRSDLYSLGCTFYYLLTGSVPYPGGSYAEKLLRHELDCPRAVSEFRPDVPRSVAAVVERLMAKRPEDRYPGAGHVASILWALAEHGWSVGTPPPERLRPATDEVTSNTVVQDQGASGQPARSEKAAVSLGPAPGEAGRGIDNLPPSSREADRGAGGEGLFEVQATAHPQPLSPERQDEPGKSGVGANGTGSRPPSGTPSVESLRESRPHMVVPPPRRRLPGIRAVAFAALSGALIALAFVGFSASPSPLSERAPADAPAPPFRIARLGCDFITLTEAITAAADGDVVTICGSGPYRLPPTELAGKELTLRSTGRERPRLEPKNPDADGPWQALFASSGSLTMEGLDLVSSSDAPLIAGAGATIRLTDCRLTATGGGPAAVARGGTLCLQSCRVRAAITALAIEADTVPCLAELAGNDIAACDPAGAALAVWAPETAGPTDVVLSLEGNSIQAGRVTSVRALPGRLRVCANANDFTFSEALLGFSGYSDSAAWRRSTTWQGRDNRCHTTGYWIREDGRPVAVNDSAGWQRLWAEPAVAGRGQEASARPATLR
jgi:serine/threonine protein kinase